MNPTLYRELQKPVVLQEPIDITHELLSEPEWAEAWMNYKPVMIVGAPKPTPEAGMDCAFDNGFREACTRVLAMADDYFVRETPAHTRFCLTVRRMYDGRL